MQMTNPLGRIARATRKARQNLARGTRTLNRASPPPLRLARKRNPKNLNVVVQGQRKNRTSLVRRQAANTSLSHDQGSIRFFSLIFLLNVFIVSLTGFADNISTNHFEETNQ